MFRQIFSYRRSESVTDLQHQFVRPTREELIERRKLQFLVSFSNCTIANVFSWFHEYLYAFNLCTTAFCTLCYMPVMWINSLLCKQMGRKLKNCTTTPYAVDGGYHLHENSPSEIFVLKWNWFYIIPEDLKQDRKHEYFDSQLHGELLGQCHVLYCFQANATHRLTNRAKYDHSVWRHFGSNDVQQTRFRWPDASSFFSLHAPLSLKIYH